MTYNNTFGNDTVPPSQYGYQALSISANTTLVWPYNSTGGTTTSKLIDLTATAGSLSLTLPDATQVSTGEDILIRNVGAHSVTIKDNGGGTIGTVSAGAASYFYLTSNATAAGTWGLIAYGVGTSAVDAATLVGYGLIASGSTLNQASPVTTDAGSTVTVDVTYRAKTLVLTGGAATVALPAVATAADNFFLFLRNGGTGTATINPDGAELIDGASTLGIQPGESLMLVCSGAAWYTVGYGRAVLYQFSQLVKDVSVAGSFTLTASEASNKLLTFTGNPAGAVTIIVPNTVAVYYTQSSISTAQTITVKTAAGTGASLPQSQRIIMICDGTNVVGAQSAAATSAISFPSGSAASPSINFSSSTNSGLFLKGLTGVGIAVNGTEVAAVESGGITFSQPLVTPNIGVATATSINGIPLTYSDLALDSLLVGATTPSLTSGVGNFIFGTGVYAITSGSTNTLMGNGSGVAITSGAGNTVFGRGALYTVSTTSNNTALGEGAGALSTGSQNTFVGASAGTGSYSGSNLIVVGYNTLASSVGVSNEITLGNSSIATLRCQVTSITALSDVRDKTDVAPLPSGLSTVMALNPVRFTWSMRDGGKVGVKDSGFIAQDLQEVDDEWLRLVYAENPEKLEASYGRLIPVLVKAIQELKAEIEELKRA